VGLHPDQATDFILDFALEFKKPFTIIPCCVFPTLFANRRFSGKMPMAQLCEEPGEEQTHPVLSYPDLVQYLVERGRAQLATLPFEGANLAVFRLN
jgi:hypothetical protein